MPPKELDTPQDILLKGVVRVENVENPEQYVAAALGKCKKKHVLKTYEMENYVDHIDFLEQLARKGGRLLKGGEADVDGVAKMVLNDFLRGKLPWFTPLPAIAGAGTGAATTSDEKPAGDAVDAGSKKGVEGGRTGDVNRLNKVAITELRAAKRKRGAADVDGAEAEAEDEEESELLNRKRAQTGDVTEDDDNESFASFTDDSESEDGDAGDDDDDVDGPGDNQDGEEGVSLSVPEGAS